MSSDLILRAWEALGTERELQGVLKAITDLLEPVVPYDGLGIVHFDGVKHDLYALHVPKFPLLEAETLAEYFQRLEPLRKVVPQKPLKAYTPVHPTKFTEDGPYVCDDLFECEAWLEHEFHLAASGVRSYCSIPLIVRQVLIGVATFTRGERKPFTPEELSVLVDVSRALGVAVANALANAEVLRLREKLEAENIALREQLGQAPWFEGIAGDSAALRRVLESVEQVAATDATVLITGETGTGKELIARALHRRSPRASGPLVKVNCAAIPETLLASELFGHERGAFTGALERRKGRFEQAHGGTLFLDEIGEMPPDTQVMLLRVLQEREFERLGGNATVRVDVRIVAATNRDLEEQVRQGKFRSDLYYRLTVFPIRVPPLRERREDIPLLASYFAARYGEQFGRPIASIEVRSMEALCARAWPGNVRELENVIERAVIVARHGVLKVDHEAAGLVEAPPPVAERAAIEEALRAARGRVSGANGAARRLGMPASTLEFRIKRLGIDKFRYRVAS